MDIAKIKDAFVSVLRGRSASGAAPTLPRGMTTPTSPSMTSPTSRRGRATIVRVPAFLLLVALLFLPASAGRYALLVGCNNGGSSVTRLQWAESDAQHFADLLTRIGGFGQGEVTTLLHPDSSALETQLRKIRSRLRASQNPENDLFLLYYSGHADGNSLLLETTRYSLKKLRTCLDSLPSGVRIGVFDACQSGAVAEYKGGKRAQPFYLNSEQKAKGQVIIASAASNEHAQESQSLKGSVFTFYWLAGLRGNADASGNGQVTIDEAYTYAYRKTVETSALSGGEVQHPEYRFNIHGQGNIVLTDLSKSNGGLLLDKSCEGKFLVLSDTYTDIFGDFAKKKNTEKFIALDPGRYTVINARGSDVGMYSFSLGQGSVRLAQTMLVANPLSESRIKGAAPEIQAKIAEPETSPLSVHSWGIGAGGFPRYGADSGSVRPVMSVSFSNLVYLNKRCNLFFDGSYITGGLNVGADAGFDFVNHADYGYLFAGGGVNFLYLGRNGGSFVPGFLAHAGCGIPVGRQTELLLQVPVVFGVRSTISTSVGFEVKLLFTGPYRDVKVLHY